MTVTVDGEGDDIDTTEAGEYDEVGAEVEGVAMGWIEIPEFS